MGYDYVILGAGRQGAALAYDLARNGEAGQITLVDSDSSAVQRVIDRLTALLPNTTCQLTGARCDVSQPSLVAPHVAGSDVIVSAVPYRFNLALTDVAVNCGASFCDLGGNTGVVEQQLTRHERAKAAGVSIVPDCGLAPGLGNILAAHGVASMDEPEDVHVRCGGLPERPVGALGYKLVFNFDGLINEYSGFGEFLRDHQRVQIPALTELETIDFPPPVGCCEAAVTSGGTSTCPYTFRGRLQTYDYKTVRYPGHFAIVRALFELGAFDDQVSLPDGSAIRPRLVLRRLLEQRLAFPEVRDLVVLRCTVSGRHQGRPCTRQYDLFDRHDERTGFSAMERTTAFPTAVVAHMQARRRIAPGARPLETAVPTAEYVAELPRHDIQIAGL